jgi:hypothetical protein
MAMKMILAIGALAISALPSFAGDSSWDGAWDGNTETGAKVRVRFEGGEVRVYRFRGQIVSLGFSSTDARQAKFGAGAALVTVTRTGPNTASFVYVSPRMGNATATLTRK